MLQRIQTVFLLLVVALFAVLFFVPVYEVKVFTEHGTKDALPMTNLVHLAALPLFLALMAAQTLIALVTIFLFRNRKRQIGIAMAGLYFSIVIIAVVFSLPRIFSGAYLVTAGDTTVDFAWGIYLQAVAPLLFFLAARFTRKDEELVKAADRLR